MPGNVEAFLTPAKTKPKAHLPKLGPAAELGLDSLENLLDDSAGAGQRLTAGVRKAVASLDQLAGAGLTFDALVLLVQAKCEPPARGGHPPNLDTVANVLRAFFRLEEHLR